MSRKSPPYNRPYGILQAPARRERTRQAGEAEKTTPMSDMQAIRRDHMGQIVRHAWVEWAKQQPSPKPSWLVPWEGLSESDREVDRQIGEAVLASQVRVRADSLVMALGWEWEAFEGDARHESSDVLRETLAALGSPPSGDPVNDMKADGAAKWIKDELARRDGPIWPTSEPRR